MRALRHAMCTAGQLVPRLLPASTFTRWALPCRLQMLFRGRNTLLKSPATSLSVTLVGVHSLVHWSETPQLTL